MSQPEDFEKFWKEYDTSEIDTNHLSKHGLCHKILDTVIDDSKKKEIESEINLHNFYFWIHSSIENIHGLYIRNNSHCV